MLGFYQTGYSFRGPRLARPAGYTLVELVVVLLIAAILSVVGIGMYSGSVVHHQLEGAAGRVIADLSLARQHAVTTGTSQIVTFTPGTGRYVLNGMNHPDRPADPYEVDLASAPYEATIVSADLGGDGEIIFDAFGKPDSGGTIVIRAAEREKTVSVNAETGRASAQ